MAELNEAQQQARKLWSSGDYASAMHTIATVGPRAVEAAGVTGDDVVLDVACGNGNATIPAAKTGANVTGIDLTPSLLEAGKVAAKERWSRDRVDRGRCPETALRRRELRCRHIGVRLHVRAGPANGGPGAGPGAEARRAPGHLRLDP